MKKLSKLIAVVAAMAMFMAMSTSAFAAITNPSPENNPNGINGQQVTIDGVTGVLDSYEIKAPSKALIRNALTQGGYDAANIPDTNIKVLCSLDVDWWYQTGVDGAGDPIWDYGTDKKLSFDMYVPGVNPGDTVYVLHLKHDGTWEAAAYEVGADGTIHVTLEGLSQMYVVQVLQEMARLNGQTGQAGKSPKTGF